MVDPITDKRLIRLVRDKIHKLFQGELPTTYELISQEKHIELLRKKLIEEAAEYLIEPSIEELGDILEIVRSLARVDLNISFEDLIAEADLKKATRGGYEKGVGMFAQVKLDTDSYERVKDNSPTQPKGPRGADTPYRL